MDEFSFRQSRDRLRVRDVLGIDLDRVRYGSIAPLQSVLKNLAYGEVVESDVGGTTVKEVVHFMRVSQVAMQYLLHSQRRLSECVKVLHEKNSELQAAGQAQRKEIVDLKTATQQQSQKQSADAVLEEDLRRIRAELVRTQKDLEDERARTSALRDDLAAARRMQAVPKATAPPSPEQRPGGSDGDAAPPTDKQQLSQLIDLLTKLTSQQHHVDPASTSPARHAAAHQYPHLPPGVAPLQPPPVYHMGYPAPPVSPTAASVYGVGHTGYANPAMVPPVSPGLQAGYPPLAMPGVSPLGDPYQQLRALVDGLGLGSAAGSTPGVIPPHHSAPHSGGFNAFYPPPPHGDRSARGRRRRHSEDDYDPRYDRPRDRARRRRSVSSASSHSRDARRPRRHDSYDADRLDTSSVTLHNQTEDTESRGHGHRKEKKEKKSKKEKKAKKTPRHEEVAPDASPIEHVVEPPTHVEEPVLHVEREEPTSGIAPQALFAGNETMSEAAPVEAPAPRVRSPSGGSIGVEQVTLQSLGVAGLPPLADGSGSRRASPRVSPRASPRDMAEQQRSRSEPQQATSPEEGSLQRMLRRREQVKAEEVQRRQEAVTACVEGEGRVRRALEDEQVTARRELVLGRDEDEVAARRRERVRQEADEERRRAERRQQEEEAVREREERRRREDEEEARRREARRRQEEEEWENELDRRRRTLEDNAIDERVRQVELVRKAVGSAPDSSPTYQPTLLRPLDAPQTHPVTTSPPATSPLATSPLQTSPLQPKSSYTSLLSGAEGDEKRRSLMSMSQSASGVTPLSEVVARYQHTATATSLPSIGAGGDAGAPASPEAAGMTMCDACGEEVAAGKMAAHKRVCIEAQGDSDEDDDDDDGDVESYPNRSVSWRVSGQAPADPVAALASSGRTHGSTSPIVGNSPRGGSSTTLQSMKSELEELQREQRLADLQRASSMRK